MKNNSTRNHFFYVYCNCISFQLNSKPENKWNKILHCRDVLRYVLSSTTADFTKTMVTWKIHPHKLKAIGKHLAAAPARSGDYLILSGVADLRAVK